MAESKKQFEYMHNDPMALITALAERLIPKGIYRIQREGLSLYPDAPMSSHDRAIVQILYQQFEAVWEDTYTDNPYNVLTNGIFVKGKNSELTFHVNPLEQVIYANYNIEQEGTEAIGYPISIIATVKTERPLISNILYFEALGAMENVNTFYDSTVDYYAKQYPQVVNVWAHLKQSLYTELSRGFDQDLMTKDELDIWTQGLQQNEVVLHVVDEQACQFPTVSIFSDNYTIDDRNYKSKASASLMEGAFMFRYDRYTPFKRTS